MHCGDFSSAHLYPKHTANPRSDFRALTPALSMSKNRIRAVVRHSAQLGLWHSFSSGVTPPFVYEVYVI